MSKCIVCYIDISIICLSVENFLKSLSRNILKIITFKHIKIMIASGWVFETSK